jgi:hypothetical protein
MSYKMGVILDNRSAIAYWLREIEKDAGLNLAYLIDTFELLDKDDEEIKKLTRDDLEKLFDRYLEKALDGALDYFLEKSGAHLVLIYFNNEWIEIWGADELIDFVNFDNIYEIARKELREKIERTVRR